VTPHRISPPVVEKKQRGLGLKVLLGGHSEERRPAAAALDPFLTVFRFCLEPPGLSPAQG